MTKVLKVFDYIENFNDNKNMTVIVFNETTNHFGLYSKVKKKYYLYVKDGGNYTIYLVDDNKEIEYKCETTEHNEIIKLTKEFLLAKKIK